ncbi:MAG TPA: sigma 54-interacting transcriptional regulator [Acidobacteriaceae bacterium]|nr:sigma 54-interacting transcriptional regulator [Acidobacteriaceae bacterium]
MSQPAPLPQTLGELRASSRYNEARLAHRTVKDEMRENLINRLRDKRPLFPGVVGYEDTVVPQVSNAILSRQNFILLGLRGQAKSRILRALTGLLDKETPYVAGCEIRDNPYNPLCRRCKNLIAELEEATPIAWLTADDRYVEKLATPDVTVADLIGDLDPIKAARGGHDLASELTMHYGLLPRANRGIFAVNELPDLAGKIQVALFNILQEGDIQIKGYPVRLELDVALVFSANPEDYTARGKIVTPLKDRIGSEIRTHYAATVDEGISITRQEAWTERAHTPGTLEIPDFLREIVEQVAFVAREDRRVDKKSGVSQRLPISTLELVTSNAERRALLHGEKFVVPRITDLYAALPGITGKLELEYEGELRGADTIVREILRTAIAKVYDRYFTPQDGAPINTQQIEQWFHLGGTLQVDDTDNSKTILKNLTDIQGLIEKLSPLGIKSKDEPATIVSGAEFLLEGLYAHKKLTRTEERGFSAPEKATRKEQRQRGEEDQQYEDWQNRRSGRRGSFN